MQILGGSKDSLLKVELDVHLQVGTSLRTSRSSTPSATTKKGIKQLFGINLSTGTARGAKVEGTITEIESFKATCASKGTSTRSSGSASSKATIGIHSSMPKLIVELALFIVRQDFVSLRGFLELVSCFVIIL